MKFGFHTQMNNWQHEISHAQLLERAMLAGPPEHVVEQVQELREVCGIENLITFMDTGGVPHNKIMRSLELFGTKVIPEFKGL